MKRISLLLTCIALTALSGTVAAADRIVGPLILEELQQSPLGLYGVAGPLPNGQVPMLVNPQGPAQAPHLWTDLDALLAQGELDQVVFPGEGLSGPITRLDAPGQCLRSVVSSSSGTKVWWEDEGEGSPYCTVWQNQSGQIIDLSSPRQQWLTYLPGGSNPGYLVSSRKESTMRVRTDLMVDLAP